MEVRGYRWGKTCAPKTKACGCEDHHMIAIGKDYQEMPRGREGPARAACIRVTNSKDKDGDVTSQPSSLCVTRPLDTQHTVGTYCEA